MADIVFQLDNDHLTIARSLFDGATFDCVFVDAVFEGRQPGTIFVDDAKTPTSAVLCRTYDYFFAGAAVPELRRFVTEAPAEASVFGTIDDLAAARLAHVIAMYGYVPISPAWHEALLADHAGRLEIIGRRAFTFERTQADRATSWYEHVPDGFSVTGLDEHSAERVDREIGELIGLFWGGYAAFGAGGFGAFALAGDRVAGAAYTISVSDREVNVGIGVAEPFRRRGLATTLARACAARAFERGLTPNWDCDSINVPSGDLALRVGFTEQPSFAELAFPNREGPVRSHGLWRREPAPHGVTWRRLPHS